VYSAEIENEGTLKQHIFYACQTFCIRPRKGMTVHDPMCSSLRWFRWRIFWAILWIV